jgi:hypothetical protein
LLTHREKGYLKEEKGLGIEKKRQEREREKDIEKEIRNQKFGSGKLKYRQKQQHT